MQLATGSGKEKMKLLLKIKNKLTSLWPISGKNVFPICSSILMVSESFRPWFQGANAMNLRQKMKNEGCKVQGIIEN